MAKHKGNTAEVAEAGITVNMQLVYRRDHPKDRCSYGVAGNSGIVVFDKSLFAGGDGEGFVPPTTITLDVQLVEPKADNKELKAQQAAAKAAEKAEKAAAKAVAAQAKIQAKADKAAADLAAAQAKVDAAAATPAQA